MSLLKSRLYDSFSDNGKNLFFVGSNTMIIFKKLYQGWLHTLKTSVCTDFVSPTANWWNKARKGVSALTGYTTLFITTGLFLAKGQTSITVSNNNNATLSNVVSIFNLLQNMPSQAYIYENLHNTITIEELQKRAPHVREIFLAVFKLTFNNTLNSFGIR